jgi:hypothetical protein
VETVTASVNVSAACRRVNLWRGEDFVSGCAGGSLSLWVSDAVASVIANAILSLPYFVRLCEKKKRRAKRVM